MTRGKETLRKSALWASAALVLAGCQSSTDSTSSGGGIDNPASSPSIHNPYSLNCDAGNPDAVILDGGTQTTWKQNIENPDPSFPGVWVAEVTEGSKRYYGGSLGSIGKDVHVDSKTPGMFERNQKFPIPKSSYGVEPGPGPNEVIVFCMNDGKYSKNPEALGKPNALPSFLVIP